VTLERLIFRDGGACVWCGRRPWRADLTAEHLLPRSRHGRAIPENLALACRGCNKRRRTKPITAFVRAQLDAGQRPRLDLLQVSLKRLAECGSRRHAEYARRELELLRRL
jgi:hypothetical protein